jgi:hypothetical protein
MGRTVEAKNRNVLIFIFNDLHADTAGKFFKCSRLGAKYSKDWT